MSSGAVHFKGRDQVLSAYEANGIGPWALMSGKNILAQFREDDTVQGAALLEEWISRLYAGGSTALYQLRIYEDPLKGAITNTTPFNYSFQFRLIENEETGYSRGLSSPVYAQMEARIKKLEMEKAALEDDDDEGEIGGIQGFIGSILQKPEVQEMILNKFLGFMGGIMGRTPQPASMAGVPVPGQASEVIDMTTVYANLPSDQRQQLDKALEILLTKDAQAGTRLYKIAMILKENPARYEMLAGML